MDKKVIQKGRTFEQSLFEALAGLAVGESVDVSFSILGTTKNLVSKWNRRNVPNQQTYAVRVLPVTVDDITHNRVMVFRTK